jgi:hypothetical protein
MSLDQAADRRGELAILVFVVLGLLLLVAAGTSTAHWLSARWDTACHLLPRAPSAPGIARPWRLAEARPETPCAPRTP